MTINKSKKDEPCYLLALHSSSETFGVAVLDYRDPTNTKRNAIFPIGKNLSNKIFSCVEEVLPSKAWKKLGRIAVSIGPGGFTGTRLSVVMARTLCEQIGCQLDGISSFKLMAPRLVQFLEISDQESPFWIIKELPRRGTIGGHYQVKYIHGNNKEIIELKKPHLIKNNNYLRPALLAKEDISKDTIQLLDLCEKRHTNNQPSSWEHVLPIYPTSPVQ